MSQAEQELDALFEYIRKPPSTRLEWGTAFEIIIRDYLKNDSAQKIYYEEVLLWDDFANKYGEGEPDTGIDVVAKRKDGTFTAIQCKFYDEDNSVTRKSTNSFFSLAALRYNDEIEFTHKILAITTEKLSSHLENYIKKDKEIKLIRKQDLVASNINWKIYLDEGSKIKYRERFSPKPYQGIAIDEVIKGFSEADRGQLIMACGTGKTLTGLRFMEGYLKKDSLVLVAVPSIALISQTIREYCHQAWDDDIYPIAVCSQQQKKDIVEEDMQIRDLWHPTSTEPNYIADYVKRAEKGKRCIVFTTYQSMERIAKAQKEYGLPEFDLIIADEAHRTAGSSKEAKEHKSFTLIHNNENVAGKKRLYMTATPRVFTPSSQKRAENDNVLLYSMDNEAVFGKPFYELGFGEAVKMGELSDYKVLVTVVDDRQALNAINSLTAIAEAEGEKHVEIQVKDAAKMIGIHKAIAKKELLRALKEQGSEIPSLDDWEINDNEPMNRVINFTPKISHSQQVASIFPKFKEAAKTEIDVGVAHIDGKMTALARENIMRTLRDVPESETCRMLTNAKCLTEGVDVPALDGVCFYNKKKSFVDIIQAVGRVLRKSPGKDYGYIILPVCISADQIIDVDTAISNNEDFETIWQVLAALKAHDKRALIDETDYRKKIFIIDGTEDEEAKAEREKRKQEKAEKDEFAEKLDEQLSLSLAEEIFNAIVDVAGEAAFWKYFGQDVKKVVNTVELRIRDVVERDSIQKQRFKALLESFQKNIQNNIDEDLLFSTLAQHITTEPIFNELFSNDELFKRNVIALALNNFLLDAKKKSGIDAELKELEYFYSKTKEMIKGKNKARREEIIEGFYNSFITTAFPKMKKKHGIVYTPLECVDFVLNSTEALLRKHFNCSISEENVNVLDPFTGTGTFIKRLLSEDLNLIKDKNLLHKYQNEIHANELILLAYYVALLRIENAFNSRYDGDYASFQNAVLGDTFDYRTQGELELDMLKEAGEKWEKQSKQDITVIIGNPPYSKGQRNEMDDNKNAHHPKLEEDIKKTYIYKSRAQNKVATRDSYIKALRWGTDRIQDKGMISFIINGAFIDTKAGDGIRACFGEDFSHIYIMNLKGNTRKKGEEVKKEGGKIFDTGARITVAIIFLVKDGTQVNRKADEVADIQYFEIDDYLEREEKLKYLKEAGSVNNIDSWRKLTPNKRHSWINLENEKFEEYIACGNKPKKDMSDIESIFGEIYTIGIKTNRDPWMLNFSEEKLQKNMRLHIKTFCDDLNKYKKGTEKDVKKVISTDKSKIKYTDTLIKRFNHKEPKPIVFDEKKIRKCFYNPFQIKYSYYTKELIERAYKTEDIMPDDSCENIFICTAGTSHPNDFFAIATNKLPSANIGRGGQCFPLYHYKKEKKGKNDLINAGNVSAGKPLKQNTITEWALETFRKQYKEDKITRLDIFNYVYGIFHSPKYKIAFADSLRQGMPRIPFVKNKELFWQFSDAGKKLMKLHLNYETAKFYKGLDVKKAPQESLLDRKADNEKELYRVNKMKFNANKSIIYYNDIISIENIPPKAHEYIIDGYSAMEWIMVNYEYEPPKEEKIAQDPNDYSDDPKYILNLLKSIITVSVETVDIVNSLPELDIDEESEFYSLATKF